MTSTITTDSVNVATGTGYTYITLDTSDGWSWGSPSLSYKGTSSTSPPISKNKIGMTAKELAKYNSDEYLSSLRSGVVSTQFSPYYFVLISTIDGKAFELGSFGQPKQPLERVKYTKIINLD